ncbi:hypothetical protein EYF80_048590 [Liparis tanakae]|uniref:Uncharacterized protein n=1 Tax=Liparis tanakae TaxID=230148 RepID=A0A4Z2FKC7_9TELE|nr:hypothetical protein EYF80_048590 [Liparis tanakae]
MAVCGGLSSRMSSPSQGVHHKVVPSDALVDGFFKGLVGKGGGRSHLLTEERFLPPYLVVPEEDGSADGVEEHAVRTPAELVAERIVGTFWSRKRGYIALRVHHLLCSSFMAGLR